VSSCVAQNETAPEGQMDNQQPHAPEPDHTLGRLFAHTLATGIRRIGRLGIELTASWRRWLEVSSRGMSRRA
jgi:hypothetical protein